MVATLEGEHQALAAGIVAYELQRIPDRLRTADVEVYAALVTELALGILGDERRKFDLLAMQILRSDLRQLVELAMGGRVQALVAVAEIDGGVPHLQIEERRAGAVINEGAFASFEELRLVRIVNRIAVGAIDLLKRAQFFFGADGLGLAAEGFGCIRFHSMPLGLVYAVLKCGSVRERRSTLGRTASIFGSRSEKSSKPT